MTRVPQAGKILNRETAVALMRAALESGENRFARGLALAWLSAFPGDLEITLLQAYALLSCEPGASTDALAPAAAVASAAAVSSGDANGLPGRRGPVVAALELVLRKDPFYVDAYDLLARTCLEGGQGRFALAAGCLYALSGRTLTNRLEDWAQPLRLAVTALEGHRAVEAEEHLKEVLRLQPDLLLAAALHLLIHRQTAENLPIEHLARIYHSRWPECLPISLVLAEACLEQGDEPEAVRLLHQCAAGDSTGQVARRLWGEQHPYRMLWPEEMVIYFDQPIPAGAAGKLGWNILNPGEILPPVPLEPLAAGSLGGEAADSLESEPASEVAQPGDPETGESNQNAGLPSSDQISLRIETAAPPEEALEAEGHKHARDGCRAGDTPGRNGSADPTTRAVENELERLAKQLKHPALGRADGRCPVYVIFSCKSGLTEQYGPQTTAVLDGELRKLSERVRQRPGWNALVYYPDDPACTIKFDLLPVTSRDPWKLKNALADLDAALGKRGERIGALLIAGGDLVVPFHRLPNPTDDDDGEVASDSPYATLDANYFVPEWPVGRLPGETGPDACLLLEQLRAIQRYHVRRAKRRVILGLDWVAMFKDLFERLAPAKNVPSFGYTAAIWRRSSLAVFRPIGAPHTVLASPPEQSGSFHPARIMSAGLGYYNLHGLVDSPAWYGQGDPLEAGRASDEAAVLVDYPVALAPDDLQRNGHSPRVVFSEACYGGHISGKREQESLALRFLAMGTLAVIGSTCISYGSVVTPLIAADLLGNLFWQHLKAGYTAGEALLKAKVDLVREMERRQGYLDGEDQKTLISFVLYGDPLAGYDGMRVRSKLASRPKDHPMVKTVCDLREEGAAEPKLTGEALRQVKEIVAEYLPGAGMAEMHLSRQHAGCDGEGHHCPTSQLSHRKSRGDSASRGDKAGRGSSASESRNGTGRVVVTASKQVKIAQHIQRQYVRVTLDEAGKPVKLSVSR